MNKEHTQILFTEFSELYRGRNKSLKESLMAFGFDCQDGWFDIIYNLSKELTEYGIKKGRIVEAVQVKEKFGTLRFYLRNSDDAEEDIVTKYMKLSGTTCELCGAPGRHIVSDSGWHMTRCEKHKDVSQVDWVRYGGKKREKITVGELIEELKKYPPETRVVIPGSKADILSTGYNDIAVVDNVQLILNCYNGSEGKHEEKSYCDSIVRKAQDDIKDKTFETVNAVILSNEELLKFT